MRGNGEQEQVKNSKSNPHIPLLTASLAYGIFGVWKFSRLTFSLVEFGHTYPMTNTPRYRASLLPDLISVGSFRGAAASGKSDVRPKDTARAAAYESFIIGSLNHVGFSCFLHIRKVNRVI
jgi:hypothetical protein